MEVFPPPIMMYVIACLFVCFFFKIIFTNLASLFTVFMAHSDLLNLLFAVGVWCSAYIVVAVIASLRIIACLCLV